MPGPHATRVALIDASVRSAAFDPGVSRPPNRLLQVLAAAETTSPCPHLKTVELPRGAVERSSALQKLLTRPEQPR
jgi:hypothetical protein